ncbi:Zinc finger protein ZIC 2 [Coemansia spiralis]|uniref:Zinc finger protein ZIC 2 n=2 Tax=Coemansia TaxID=4863 RepID=A0A9W8GA52_9FUNG|nr:Zinc finger protein ZIC 2 [Coemansia spiralis]
MASPGSDTPAMRRTLSPENVDSTAPFLDDTRATTPSAPAPEPLALNTAATANTTPIPSRAVCAWSSCSAEFGTMHQLAAHLLSFHIDGESSDSNACEWTTCPSKGQHMPTRSDLILHLKNHTGNRSYLCPVDGCGKVYKRSDFLARHINTHSAPSPTSKPAVSASAKLSGRPRRKAAAIEHTSTATTTINATVAEADSNASSLEDAPLALISNPNNPSNSNNHSNPNNHSRQLYGTNSKRRRRTYGSGSESESHARHINDSSDYSSTSEAHNIASVGNGGRIGRSRRRIAAFVNNEDGDDDNDNDYAQSAPKFTIDMPESEQLATMLEAQLAYIREEVSARKEKLLRYKAKMRRLRLENDILIDALART